MQIPLYIYSPVVRYFDHVLPFYCDKLEATTDLKEEAAAVIFSKKWIKCFWDVLMLEILFTTININDCRSNLTDTPTKQNRWVADLL